MTMPKVTETLRPLQAVTPDPFIAFAVVTAASPAPPVPPAPVVVAAALRPATVPPPAPVPRV